METRGFSGGEIPSFDLCHSAFGLRPLPLGLRPFHSAFGLQHSAFGLPTRHTRGSCWKHGVSRVGKYLHWTFVIRPSAFSLCHSAFGLSIRPSVSNIRPLASQPDILGGVVGNTGFLGWGNIFIRPLSFGLRPSAFAIRPSAFPFGLRHPTFGLLPPNPTH